MVDMIPSVIKVCNILQRSLFMKAVMKVARGVGNIELRDIEEPTPQLGQVKIKVLAGGICGTHLDIYKVEFRAGAPVVLRHEIAGEMDELGDGVIGSGLEAAMRVTTETYFSTCGICAYCPTGHQNLCLN